jgi:hypothetical protein
VKTCNIQGVIEPGNVCTGDQNMPSAHYQEFAKLLAKWQADEADFLTFHPADTLLSATLRKPNALPVSFSYTDGFSPALFRYILDRAEPVIQSLRTGRALIATMDLAQLNELQWALLRRIVATWDLIPVEETEHFAVYRLEVRQAAARRTMVLPDRPIKTRNGF